MTIGTSQRPLPSALIAQAHSFNESAVDALAVPQNWKYAREQAERSLQATRWIGHHQITNEQMCAAIVEKIVSYSILGLDVTQAIVSLESNANLTTNPDVARDMLADYVTRVAAVQPAASRPLTILRSALEQLDSRIWTAELRKSGFPNGFSAADIVVLHALSSDSWNTSDPIVLDIPQIVARTHLSAERVSAIVEPLERGDFVARTVKERGAAVGFALTQKGWAALTHALTSASHGVTVA